ncbi:Gfo/Idh/MocA family oxidoreductase [Saccharopolyspora erythraea]|uniref:Gfo/Idh/MocA family protein n=1 Tax=Saccharopolyspora erythraea TaxID=1836 RepID=UPI001BAB73B5|nr:Gfo/Idh/MocA family oxidoreductase [Saccharopolyspora erythraea]QUH01936.1 Gfo/Idh/MocA family oxidoreductase [Saccharopolyspora erythraea]
MSAVRLGVLGCSAIARRRTLPAAALVPELTTAAVASRSPEKARRFAAEFGTAATDYDSLLADPGIEAVYISLPTALHHEWTRRALDAGKHVLCEKPLTEDSAKTRELTELAADKELVLRENFAFLHHPAHSRVRELVDQNRLGLLRTFTAAFGIPPLTAGDIRYAAELGGGALLDVGVYPLRAALLLLGPDLSVAGATLRVDESLGVDVAGHALLVSGGGVFANLEFGFQHCYRSRYALWGSSASLSMDRAFTPPAQHQPVLRIDEQDHAEEITLAPSHQFVSSVSAFAHAVRLRSPYERDWLDDANALAALVESVRDQAVLVPAKDPNRGREPDGDRGERFPRAEPDRALR